MKFTANAANYLAKNLESLRAKKNLSQSQLAHLAGIPRSTLTNMASGAGNPSLSNLVNISTALGVGIEELLSRPRTDTLLISSKDVPKISKLQGRALLYKLIPDKIKGIEWDAMELQPGALLGGHPHLEGTKEYLHVVKGEMTVHISGEEFIVQPGDVLAFAGNQPHSYRNSHRSVSTAISMVIPIPVFL